MRPTYPPWLVTTPRHRPVGGLAATRSPALGHGRWPPRSARHLKRAPSGPARRSAQVSVLGARRIDELRVEDVNELGRELARTGRKRETIRKSVKYLAAVLEEKGIEPNPARDK